MLLFMEWVRLSPKLNKKFLSVKDFFFHWLNQSGNEDGLRHQFEAIYRSQRNDNPEEKKNLFKAMKRANTAVAEEIPTVPSGSPKCSCGAEFGEFCFTNEQSGENICAACVRKLQEKSSKKTKTARVAATMEEGVLVKTIDVDEL